MREFEFICKILHDRYIASAGEDLEMIEAKECGFHKPHIVKICSTRPIDNLRLYRFSLDDEDFLPFFKDSRTYPDGYSEGGPKGLKKFCDYIMLIESNDRLTIAMIEMKRSKKDTGYRDQLDASRLFMDYIIANAERIKERNSFADFNGRDIEFRKIKIVNNPAGNKLQTKPRLKVLTDGRDDYIILPLGSHLNPKWII